MLIPPPCASTRDAAISSWCFLLVAFCFVGLLWGFVGLLWGQRRFTLPSTKHPRRDLGFLWVISVHCISPFTLRWQTHTYLRGSNWTELDCRCAATHTHTHYTRVGRDIELLLCKYAFTHTLADWNEPKLHSYTPAHTRTHSCLERHWTASTQTSTHTHTVCRLSELKLHSLHLYTHIPTRTWRAPGLLLCASSVRAYTTAPR